MKSVPITAVNDAGELIALLATATPGSAFSLKLGDGRAAILTLSALLSDEGAGFDEAPNQPGRSNTCHRVFNFGLGRFVNPGGKSKNELFGIATHKIFSKVARSYHGAAVQLVDEGEYRGNGGTPENRAHRLGKLFRAHLKSSAFEKIQKTELTNPITAASKDLILLSETKIAQPHGGRMTTQDKSLGPDRLRRVRPKQFIIDLVREELADATYDEIMSPAFWVEAGDYIQTGDTVILVRDDASTIVLGIGAPDPATGGFWPIDLARSVAASRTGPAQRARPTAPTAKPTPTMTCRTPAPSMICALSAATTDGRQPKHCRSSQRARTFSTRSKAS